MNLARRIIDISIALFLYFICVVFFIAISEFISQNNLLLHRISDMIGWSAAIYFLLKRYPLEEKVFSLSKGQGNLLIKYGVLSGLLVAILSYPYAYIHNNRAILQDSFLGPQHSSAAIAIFLFIAIFVSPSLEEMFTRACLFRILKEKIGFFLATLLSTCFFVMLHNIFGYGEFLRLFIISLVLTISYEVSGTIKTSIIAHITGNAVWYIVVYGRLYSII